MTDTTWCEVDRCGEPATWRVRGQWGIFDWLHVYVCDEHEQRARDWLWRRTVDTQPCLELISERIPRVDGATAW